MEVNKLFEDQVFRVSISRKELKMLMSMCQLPMFSKTVDGAYIVCSQSFYDYFGVAEKEDSVFSPEEVFDAKTFELICQKDRELLQTGGSQQYAIEIDHVDGNSHQVLVSQILLQSVEGEPAWIYGRIKDLTQEERDQREKDRLIRMRDAVLEVNNASLYSDSMEDLLELILEKMLSLVENAKIGTVLFKNLDGNLVIRANSGYDAEKIRGFALQPEESFLWKQTKGKMQRAEILHLEPEENLITPPLEHEEKPFIIRSSISAPIFVEGDFYGLINVDSEFEHAFGEEDRKVLEFMRAQIEGVINRRRLYEQSKKMSQTDVLTHLNNRLAFETKLSQAIENNQAFFVVMFDLDRMKEVNDTYGHDAGDQLLQLVAKELEGLYQDPRDVVARFGGDEFIGIFYRDERLSLLRELESLDQDFQKNPLIVEHMKLFLSFSYGVVSYPDEAKTARELILEVDSRMYKYKRKRRKKRMKP